MKFDEGFSSGVNLGIACGNYLAAYTQTVMDLMSASDSCNENYDELVSSMRKILMEDVPARSIDYSTIMESIDASFLKLPDTLRLNILSEKSILDCSIKDFYGKKDES